MKKLLAIWIGLVIWFGWPVLVLAAGPAGFINDEAGVLTLEQKAELESLAVTYEAESGNEIAVLTVPELIEETIEEKAVKVFEEWGVGKKGKDNGVLLILAIKDREVRLEVGYGLEGVLTDIRSEQIINEVMVPELRNENYFGAIKGAMTRIMAIAAGEEFLPVEDNGGKRVDDGKITWYIFLGYLVIAIFSRTKSWWLGGVLGITLGFIWWGLVGALGLAVVGLILDFLLSKAGASPVVRKMMRTGGIWGGGHSSGGGGFGGFGGGGSGGGGSSGKW